MVVTGLGVLVGGLLSQYIPVTWLRRIVAVAFIVIGVQMLAGMLKKKKERPWVAARSLRQ